MSETTLLKIPLLDDQSISPMAAWFRMASRIENGLLGRVEIDITSGDTTLTDDQSRFEIFIVSSGGVASAMILPEGLDYVRPHIIVNNCDFTLVVKTASSSGVEIAPASIAFIFNAGANIQLIGSSEGSSIEGIAGRIVRINYAGDGIEEASGTKVTDTTIQTFNTTAGEAGGVIGYAGYVNGFHNIVISNDADTGAQFGGHRARGTEETKEPPTNGQRISTFFGSGWDGLEFIAGGAIRIIAAENWGSGTNGTKLAFYTTEIGFSGDGATEPKMVLNHDGILEINSQANGFSEVVLQSQDRQEYNLTDGLVIWPDSIAKVKNLVFYGSLTGDVTLEFPIANHFWVIHDRTTRNGFKFYIQKTGGSPVEVYEGEASIEFDTI